MDAEVDCSLAAPKVSGEWVAAGPWTGPEQVALLAARRGETSPQLRAREEKERAARERAGQARPETQPAA